MNILTKLNVAEEQKSLADVHIVDFSACSKSYKVFESKLKIIIPYCKPRMRDGGGKGGVYTVFGLSIIP